MTKIDPKTIIQQENAKQFITDYWTTRAVQFKKLRQEELRSEKMQQWQDEICRRLPSQKPLKILDIGCGAFEALPCHSQKVLGHRTNSFNQCFLNNSVGVLAALHPCCRCGSLPGPA